VNGYAGEIAALATATCWALTYVFFTFAVRGIGAKALNRLRLVIALFFLLIAHLVIDGTALPLHAERFRWGWLSLSGVIGFAVADAMLFRALFHLGAHRTSLVMALVPIFTVLLGWGMLGEVLTVFQGVAILVTLCGIVLVVWDKNAETKRYLSKDYLQGVGYAIGAALAQSLRYIFSKRGMVGGFPVFSTNVIQILAATLAIWIWAAVLGEFRSTLAALKPIRIRLATIGGAFAGPFLGVTFSLIALERAPVGIASTLMALPPVFLLPLSWMFFKERIEMRAVLGTLIALAGVALVFLL
jgi:drug/metabolite transporter (DMT)-like permease